MLGELCLRLDRYLAGNKDSLAVIRVPSEEEERARHWGRQREQLVRHRQKMEALSLQDSKAHYFTSQGGRGRGVSEKSDAIPIAACSSLANTLGYGSVAD
jgi:hypothetical protein